MAMNSSEFRYTYGPVPSRRLGRSLGIDMVPFKTCTYDCIYCQLGHTTCKTTERRGYAPVADILPELKRKLAAGPAPDFLTVAGSGEPTLNENTGELIEEIKRLTSVPIAVLTNSSLLWKREVQDSLLEADLVLPSLDAGDEHLFRQVNRPHPEIKFEAMVDGLIEFRERFHNQIWLEVFLVAGLTGLTAEVEKIAALVGRIRPERVQLNTVSRPPAEGSARPVPAEQMAAFAALFGGKGEVICGEIAGQLQQASPAVSDDDILALLRRRPCTAQDVSRALRLHIAETTKRLQGLSEMDKISTVRNNDVLFYRVERKN